MHDQIDTISICICTYRRADRLALLLGDLAQQHLLPTEVIVVDNDAEASAAGTALAMQSDPATPFVLRYDLQPVKNISLTRNRSVALAQGRWLGFLDDDERAPPDWLERMFEAAQAQAYDGVLGPAVAVLPPSAPAWIQRGQFYGLPRWKSGELAPRNRMAVNNALLRADCVRREVGPFDPAFGLTGGEDLDMLSRLVLHGARIVWCDEAVVTEPVEESRLTARWILMRALRGGQDYALFALQGRFGASIGYSRPLFFCRSLAQAAIAAAMVPFGALKGKHRAIYWLIKVYANIGKLSVFWGGRYHEYA